MSRFVFYAEEAELFDELTVMHGHGNRNIEKIKTRKKQRQEIKVRKEGHRVRKAKEKTINF